jgi:hypothetical protein
VLVPGAEPTGPPPWHVQRSQSRLLVPDVTDQVDTPLEQHPPVLGGMVLLEEHVTALEADLGAHREQGEQLVVVGPGEERDPAQVVELHHIIAR